MLLLFVPVRAGVAWGAWCGEILGFVVGRRQRLTRLRLKVEDHFFNFKETFNKNKHYTGLNDKARRAVETSETKNRFPPPLSTTSHTPLGSHLLPPLHTDTAALLLLLPGVRVY